MSSPVFPPTLPSLEQFAAEVTRGGWPRQVEFFQQLGSTNDWALHRARGLPGDASAGERLPLLVWALEQTAGRGRRSNRWWSGPGALTFSLVLDPAEVSLPQELWPRVSLLVARAALEALRQFWPQGAWALKWPNDLYLQGRKLAGVLVECAPGRRPLLVVGVGVNVNNSLRHAPAELRQTATSLIDQTGQAVPLAEVLRCFLEHFRPLWQQAGSAELSLPGLWEPYCLLRGKSVTVQDDRSRVEGTCVGLDEDGALLVQTPAALQRVVAGTVVHYEAE